MKGGNAADVEKKVIYEIAGGSLPDARAKYPGGGPGEIMKKYSGYDLLLAGLFMALALVLPLLFHAIGLGSAFLPMFFPIAMAGFIVALPAALVVGVMSPLVSAFLTGMPPFFPPIVFIMMAEGLVLTTVPALLYRRLKINAWISTIITMIIDRLVMLAAILLISQRLELPEGILTTASLLKGLPGTILVILVIPPLVKKMETIVHSFAQRV